MRRAKQSGSIAGSREYGTDHRAGRAFAFRSGDVDDLHPGVRLAQPCKQLAHAVELELALLIGHERGAFEIDAAHEPVEGGLARGTSTKRLILYFCLSSLHY